MGIISWGVSKSFYFKFKEPTAVHRGAEEAEKCGERKSETERSPPLSEEPAEPYWSAAEDIKGKVSGWEREISHTIKKTYLISNQYNIYLANIIEK